jgi:methyl-accepting chemotaxis protein
METLTREQKNQAFKEINERSDTLTKYALLACFGFGLVLAFWYNTWWVAFGVGGFNLLAYFVSKTLLPGKSFYRYVLGIVYALFAAQYIYQMQGLFEMHFTVFIGATLLITYQNWRLQIPLLLTVLLHHGSFAWLQYQGMKEIFFTQLEYMDLETFLFHGGLAGVLVGICALCAFDLARSTQKEWTNNQLLGQQINTIEKNIEFANEISKGNFEFDFDTLDQHDALGESLRKMKTSLAEAKKRENEERFTTVGLNKISEIIRQHSSDKTKLCDELIITLVKYLEVNQGGLFLQEEEGDHSYLELTSMYAYSRKKYLERRIEIGQGLVGQCFLEKDAIVLKQVPDSYISITSGLGKSNPRFLFLCPIMTKDEIVGVIELASFKEMKDYEMEFVKLAAENIASSIVSVKITSKIRHLLNESQEQAEQMRAQEEEMRQNMEELQATQEEMHRKVAEYERVIEEKEQQLQRVMQHQN